MTDRDHFLLEHIAAHCEVIKGLVERFGEDYELFTSDEAYYRSVTLSVFQIGELAGKLSEDFRQETGAMVPWTQVRRMRNVIAHDYQEVDDSTLWETVLNDIPFLHEFCNTMLASSSNDV